MWLRATDAICHTLIGMTNKQFLYAAWVAANLVGFVAGSWLGATNDGLIPMAVPGYLGLVIGDLIFGSTFGLTQWLVLRRFWGVSVSALWIVAASFGFTFGARFGALLTYRLAGDWFPPSVVFGIFMGTSFGLATFLPLSQAFAWLNFFRWLAVSILAWVFGEGIAFAAGFAQIVVPVVGIVIGGITGFELVRHHKPRPAPPKT